MSKKPTREIEDNLKKQGFNFIAGVDEAGRGPLAGPVVASAVLLNTDFSCEYKIHDSKQMTARQRERAFDEISRQAQIGIGIVSEAAIDELNIFNAACRAMERAVQDLMRKKIHNVCFIVDGNVKLNLQGCSYKAIPRSDSTCISVACASIIAKVIRDRIMQVYHKIFPDYDFEKHKGYGTKLHFEKISLLGPCVFHRKTFHPVKSFYKKK